MFIYFPDPSLICATICSVDVPSKSAMTEIPSALVNSFILMPDSLRILIQCTAFWAAWGIVAPGLGLTMVTSFIDSFVPVQGLLV